MFNREKLNFCKKWWLAIDKPSFIIICAIIASSIFFVYSSSQAVAVRIGVSDNLFFYKHFVFVGLGLCTIIFISFFDKNDIKLFSLFGFCIAIVFLISVLVFGSSAKGAKRWLYILNFSLQPSELIKPFFVVTTAYLLSIFSTRNIYQRFLIVFVPYFVICFLILSQPDVGMVVVISCLFVVELFVAGFPFIWFLSIGVTAVILLLFAYMSFPHVAERIDTFLSGILMNTENYQVVKSLEAYRHGGILGQGPFEGIVKNYIPDSHTDFIFAVIGEELGLFFCILILAMFWFVILRVILKIFEEKDYFVYLSVIGLITQFAVQSIINICVSLNLLPTKGMTLPFISYGGSSFIGMSICFGMLLALTKKTYETKIDVNNLITE